MTKLCFQFLAAWAAFVVARAPAALPSVAVKTISFGELQAPVSMTNAGDGSGRLFICEQRGQVRILQNNMLLPQVFLDLSAKIVPLTDSYDERGLLGLAFHPGFASAGSPGYRKFYVFYSATSPNAAGDPVAPATTPVPVNCRTVISEFQVNASTNLADPNSERVLLTFDKPQANHNGGQLEFGPDGYLYFSVGDGGGAGDTGLGHTGASNPASAGNLGNAQDKTNLLGKIHRIDPLGSNGPGGQYGIPAGNPFVGAGSGVREEIFAYGLRNTWRFSFDVGTSGTGKLFAADVGQSNVEEIDLITSGGNFGWHAREGSFSYDSAVESALLTGGTVRIDGGNQTLPGGAVLMDPIAQYAHPSVTIGSPALAQLGTSITGGYRYRGSAIPALAGKYVFGDYNAGATVGVLLGIEETSPNVWSTPAAIPVLGTNPLSTTHVLAFGRDEQGEIFIATEVAQGPRSDPGTSLPSGGIYKIVAATASKTITAAKDNTIFSEDGLSDALGYLYVGKTGSNDGTHLRRALVSFDFSSQIPAGTTIQSARLQLNLEKVGPAGLGKTLSLYKLTQTWGEGTSLNTVGGSGAPATANDATWTKRLYPSTAWSTAGARNPSTTASAAAVAVSTGVLTWGTTPQMVSDVQGWVNTPLNPNPGWIVIGDETNATSACQFDSVQMGGSPPKLLLTYAAAPSPTHREVWLQTYFLPGHFVDDQADLDRDGLSNLVEYAFGLNPLVANPVGAGLQASFSRSGADTLFTMTFRRDPQATDLTYSLQTSPDLTHWTTLAQSVAGATTTGPATEAPVAGESPIVLVTGTETLTGPPSRRFARLQIIRQ